MKAVQIHEYGAAEVLRCVEVADPVVNDDDVGSLAVQIAKAHGAHVIATASAINRMSL